MHSADRGRSAAKRQDRASFIRPERAIWTDAVEGYQYAKPFAIRASVAGPPCLRREFNPKGRDP
jgi:hypothetical protein